MEENEGKCIVPKNGLSTLNLMKEYITVLDLSKHYTNIIEENMQLPINLTELYLKDNDLTEVPVPVLNLEKIKILDISFNNIQFFDDTPNFCETIEKLNISNNKLLGPPYWIWSEKCKHLVDVNIGLNINITKSLDNAYFEELLKYKTLVTRITINNCMLIKHLELLGTFPKARELILGSSELSNMCFTNKIEEVPFNGLDKCCDLEILELSNTNIYNMTPNINMYKNLKKINLSLNKLSSLPEEFCSLVNLEICILSCNNLLYLPDNFCKLDKLKSLLIDSNSLCMLPKNLCQLPNLRKLDLYDNYLYEAPDEMEKLLEIDLAQNYFDEPDNVDYMNKKEKIRFSQLERYDGRKLEVTKTESEYSKDETDDELLFSEKSEEKEADNRPLGSPEDWDSDEYWIPHFSHQSNAPLSTWLYFVKQKMKEGNFCPMDAHPVPIADKVKYEKLCHPQTEYESDGQFDDYSGDDS
ncbi:leucine-rich repeat and death domain-containing protein 1-like [Vanessa cardui]|uniref:leucine-rich repeat and death domain-containing protein 1-like n=1 Tax=Vanessa cardui TaxID=171605 RepID=UPI001F14748A|nr:leucine-rich repeat and death domain-containing protein 1-like [Vanessa cardui]